MAESKTTKVGCMTAMSPTNQSSGEEYDISPLVHHKGVDVAVATDETLDR